MTTANDREAAKQLPPLTPEQVARVAALLSLVTPKPKAVTR